MRAVTCFALTLAILGFVTQPQADAWPVIWGGTHNDGCFGVTPSPTGGIVAVGYSNYGGDNRWRAAAYSSSGLLIWSREETLPGGEAQDVATDSQGYIYVCGSYQGSHQTDGYTYKYTPDGSSVSWRGGFCDTAGMNDASGVAVGPSGNVVFVGYTSLEGHKDWHVVSCNTNGAPQWWDTTSLGDSSNARDVTIDSWGNVYVCGGYWQSERRKGYVMSYAPSGGVRWQGTLTGGDTISDAFGIAADALGNPIVVGYYRPSGNNVWRVEKDSGTNGEHQWHRTWSHGAGSEARAVATCRNGNIYVIGDYPSDKRRGHIIKYTSAGDSSNVNEEWGIGGNEDPYGIAVFGPVAGHDLYTAGTTDSLGSLDWAVQKRTGGTGAIGEGAATKGGRISLVCTPSMFRDRVLVTYTLSQAAAVNLAVVNSAGRVTTTLADGRRDPGSYSVSLNVTDARTRLSSGIYFCRLRVGEFTATQKMVKFQ